MSTITDAVTLKSCLPLSEAAARPHMRAHLHDLFESVIIYSTHAQLMSDQYPHTSVKAAVLAELLAAYPSQAVKEESIPLCLFHKAE